MKKDTILILGSGFIGNALLKKIYGQDNIIKHFITVDKNPFNMNLQLNDKVNHTHYKLDLVDNALDDLALDADKIKGIIHLAAPLGVSNITLNANKTFRDATAINLNVDRFASKYNIPVIYASSSEVFSDLENKNHFKIKKYSNSPRWSYAASKVHGEFLFQSSEYKTTIIRFFNIIGYEQTTPGMVFPTFMYNAIHNKDIIIKEDGIRSYCSIIDCIKQLELIYTDLVYRDLEKFNTRDINIGNPYNTISASDLAKKIIYITKSDSKIILSKNPEVEIPSRILKESDCINSSMSVLASRSIDNIIKDYIDEFYLYRY